MRGVSVPVLYTTLPLIISLCNLLFVRFFVYKAFYQEHQSDGLMNFVVVTTLDIS